MRIPFTRRDNYWIALFSMLGFLFSVTQLYGESPDYSNYDIYFDLVRSQGLNMLQDSRFEPGFTIGAAIFTALFASNVVVYSTFVAAALLLKGWAIRAYSASIAIFIVVAVFYTARFFPFHELTQLRVAVAIGILLVSAVLIWRGKNVFGLLWAFLAVLFHMSSVSVIPFLFIQPRRRWHVVLSGLVTFVGVYSAAGFVTVQLAKYISVFTMYQSAGFGENSPNPLSAVLLLDWAMIVFAMAMWNRLSLVMKRVLLLQVIGMAIFYGSLDFPVIAHRIREMFSVFWVLFLVDGLRCGIIKIPTAGFTCVSIVLFSYFYIFSGSFFL